MPRTRGLPTGSIRRPNLDTTTWRAFLIRPFGNFHNGVYAGTALSIQLDPIANKGLKTRFVCPTGPNADDSLDSLRDFISRVLARKILIQLSEVGQVVWTSALTLKSEV